MGGFGGAVACLVLSLLIRSASSAESVFRPISVLSSSFGGAAGGGAGALYGGAVAGAAGFLRKNRMISALISARDGHYCVEKVAMEDSGSGHARAVWVAR